MRTRNANESKRARGMTLVELLIVLAILAIMTGLAVPAFSKLGIFANNPTQDGSRRLYNLMRATRTNAATYHVDSALVYAFAERDDSVTGAPRVVIDRVAVARRASAEEQAELEARLEQGDPTLEGLDMDDIEEKSFVLLESELGEFDVVSEGACILLDPDYDPANLFNNLALREDLGMSYIYLFDQNPDGSLEIIVPRMRGGNQSVPLGYFADQGFPAHIFRPSGRVYTDETNVRARLELPVAAMPDVDVRERERAPYIVELYTATGRLKIVS